MIKRFFSILTICVCLIVLGVDGYILQRSLKKPTTVHLYFDLASTASLLQMIDFLQADPKDPKFFAWRRYPERSKQLNMNELNALEIKLPTNLSHMGDNKAENMNNDDRIAITRTIVWITQQYPEAQYIIHLNRKHFNIAGTNIFQAIPFDRIKRLHLYEDGHGETAALPPQKLMQIINNADIEAVKKYIRRQKQHIWGYWEAFLLQQIVPVTYHLGGYGHLQSNPDAAALHTYLSQAEIIDVSFDTLKETLSPEVKERLYRLLDVDTTVFDELCRPKTILFTLSAPKKQKIFDAQINIITALKEGKLFPEIDSSWQFFYKEHPWLTKNKISKRINEKHPEIKALQKQMPLEVLIIADALPEKIIGYSSSLFYSLTPERILAYIPALKREAYLDTLIKRNLVSQENIINLQGFMNE